VSLSETELDQKIGEFTSKIKELVGVMADSRESDKARWEAADTERERLAGELNEFKEARDVEVRKVRTEKAVADMERMLAGTRSPSKASLVGQGGRTASGYEPGQFLTALFEARNQDYSTQQQGKANLATMGSRTMSRGSSGVLELGPIDGESGKATLGTSGGAGAYIMPNAVVERLVTIATALNPMRDLLTVISGVATPTIAIPVEATAATRAVVAAWGATKANEDITFAQYTATFYTLAKIHDVANQLLRYSAGAAEQDVTQRLGRSMALGEAYYILQGSGTAEPTGIITALNTSGAYDTADIAGYATPGAAVYGTIAKAIGALENRNRTVEGAIMNPGDFWTYLALEGAAIRPYFNSFTAGQPLPTTDNRLSPLFGVPIVRNSNCPAGTAVIGEFKSATLYTGLGYRIDTSDQAGTRWDQNLTGFRAEEEIAFNATPYVVAGMFQRVTSVGT
jgi:HK97 family phage major capsid protein